MVTSPYGEIPWNRLARISDDEMKLLNKDELNAVALELGAPTADIHLGRDASEATVKHAALADYRIVYFATHGLVA